jgi:cytochrome c-type biogenesis protein CcmH/NrfG
MASTPQRIGELQRELAANPASRQFYQLGELLRRDGRAAEAVTVLRSGLAHHSRYVAAWVSLGRAYLEISQAAHAAQALDSALGLDPANPVAWRLLGEARLMLGSRLGALDAMQRALDLAPGDEVLAAAVEALASETAPPAPELAAPPPGRREPVVPAAAPVAPSRPVSAPAPIVPPVPPRRPLESLPDPFAAEDQDGGVGAAEWDVFAAEPAPVEEGAAAFADETVSEFAPGAEMAAAQGGAELEASAPPALEEPFSVAPSVETAEDAVASRSAGDEAAPQVEEPPSVGVTQPLPFPQRGAAPQAGEGPAPQPPATLTLARLYLQQQQFGAAIEVLERMLASDPDQQEARDLLALVRDMMEPLPEPLPPLSARERKIAALQRWLASITLARERVGR